ncbi:hypothetical protein ABT112_24990 [Streptomyces sp. NPDC002055]|uniref:hypothetical protein n=1 Tax=Streptomyces sp. NPDC002055 TaxID=3154534 RepID=UPI00332F3B34
MRTLTSAAALVATGGLTLGLMAAPAFATPTVSTSPATVQSGGVDSPGWATHVKNAKNVADSGVPNPSRTVRCTFVYSENGRKTHGKVCFDPSGDKFYVKDMRADGMSIYMRVMYAGNPQTVFDCRDFKGSGVGWTACEFSGELKENRRINFNALAYKGNILTFEGLTGTAQN